MPVTTLERAETQTNGFSHADKVEFLAQFRLLKNPFAALEVLGVSADSYYAHLRKDPWFFGEVRNLKSRLAWSLAPRQFERALANSVTDAIWLQKVLGGDEFNPDRRSDAAVVSLTYAPTVIQHLSKPSLLPLQTTLTSAATETRRSHTERVVRRCHCGRRGPHKSACLLRHQRRESEALSKGCGLEGEGGSVNVPQSSHTAQA